MEIKYEGKLHIYDSLLCLFIFFPITVFYWRGAWDLWGVYINPSFTSSHWILLCISVIHYSRYYTGPLLYWNLDRLRRGLYFIVTRIHLCVYSALYVCFWRAVWDIVEHYLPAGLLACCVQFLITYGILVLCQCSRTCIFPPFYISVDTRDDLLLPTTRFHTKHLTWKYLADSFFSHFIVVGLAICSWRAMWNIVGILIFPHYSVTSDLACLGIGYLLVVVFFLLEELLARMVLAVSREGFLYKLLLEDLLYLLIFLSNIILWRGAWCCCARYIIPDPELGGWICLLVGGTGLVMLQLLTFVGARGCVVDGFDLGREAIFPTWYLRHYLLSEYYAESGSSKSGSRTPPFPTDSFSYFAGSTVSVYDNLTTKRLWLKCCYIADRCGGTALEQRIPSHGPPQHLRHAASP